MWKHEQDKGFCTSADEKPVKGSEAECHYMWEYQFSVGKALDLAVATVWFVLKNYDKIKECSKIINPLLISKLCSPLCNSHC